MYGYFIVNGLLFLIVGLRALLKPIDAVAIPYGLEGEGVDARNYLRASAGGVTVVSGGVLLAAVAWPVLELPALVLAVTLLGGLVFGRLFSLCVDGLPGPTPWIAGVLELLGFGFGVYWLAELVR